MHAGESLRLKKRQVEAALHRLWTLTGEVSTLRSVAAEMRTLSGEVSVLKEQNAENLRERVAEELSMKFDEL
jgi:hypothetical protein